jgi:hypothetical protein
MFPSCTCRLNAAPPTRQQDNCIFAVPVPGRPVFAARVGVDVLPKNSLGIFPNSDSQLQYPERSPPIGAITTSHATVLMHRFYKFCYPLRNDRAFDCNEYWSLREIGSNFLDDEGHAPVVPWTQIRGRRRKFCEEHEHHTPDCSKSGTDRATPMLARWAIAPQVARSGERSSPDKPG